MFPNDALEEVVTHFITTLVVCNRQIKLVHLHQLSRLHFLPLPQDKAGRLDVNKPQMQKAFPFEVFWCLIVSVSL